ncbi:hypothetical protein VP01_605g1 [Puccinia sorghi]|uniref:Uncharacterized protein n=1 Tax=Puccinia sorghi TaxID=27349 RepID=A0A0L6UH91_9BASI|nr:hypothetical protein VP01_605g1 [Puccinia sorghi]
MLSAAAASETRCHPTPAIKYFIILIYIYGPLQNAHAGMGRGFHCRESAIPYIFLKPKPLEQSRFFQRNQSQDHNQEIQTQHHWLLVTILELMGKQFTLLILSNGLGFTHFDDSFDYSPFFGLFMICLNEVMMDQTSYFKSKTNLKENGQLNKVGRKSLDKVGEHHHSLGRWVCRCNPSPAKTQFLTCDPPTTGWVMPSMWVGCMLKTRISIGSPGPTSIVPAVSDFHFGFGPMFLDSVSEHPVCFPNLSIQYHILKSLSPKLNQGLQECHWLGTPCTISIGGLKHKPPFLDVQPSGCCGTGLGGFFFFFFDYKTMNFSEFNFFPTISTFFFTRFKKKCKMTQILCFAVRKKRCSTKNIFIIFGKMNLTIELFTLKSGWKKLLSSNLNPPIPAPQHVVVHTSQEGLIIPQSSLLPSLMPTDGCSKVTWVLRNLVAPLSGCWTLIAGVVTTMCCNCLSISTSELIFGKGHNSSCPLLHDFWSIAVSGEGRIQGLHFPLGHKSWASKYFGGKFFVETTSICHEIQNWPNGRGFRNKSETIGLKSKWKESSVLRHPIQSVDLNLNLAPPPFGTHKASFRREGIAAQLIFLDDMGQNGWIRKKKERRKERKRKREEKGHPWICIDLFWKDEDNATPGILQKCVKYLKMRQPKIYGMSGLVGVICNTCYPCTTEVVCCHVLPVTSSDLFSSPIGDRKQTLSELTVCHGLIIRLVQFHPHKFEIGTRPKTKTACTHCLVDKGAPLDLARQCVHIAFTLGLVPHVTCHQVLIDWSWCATGTPYVLALAPLPLWELPGVSPTGGLSSASAPFYIPQLAIYILNLDHNSGVRLVVLLVLTDANFSLACWQCDFSLSCAFTIFTICCLSCLVAFIVGCGKGMGLSMLLAEWSSSSVVSVLLPAVLMGQMAQLTGVVSEAFHGLLACFVTENDLGSGTNENSSHGHKNIALQARKGKIFRKKKSTRDKLKKGGKETRQQFKIYSSLNLCGRRKIHTQYRKHKWKKGEIRRDEYTFVSGCYPL